MILRDPATTTTCKINTVAARSARATIPVLCGNRWWLGVGSGPLTFSTTCGSSLLLASLTVDEVRWPAEEGDRLARSRSDANLRASSSHVKTHLFLCGQSSPTERRSIWHHAPTGINSCLPHAAVAQW